MPFRVHDEHAEHVAEVEPRERLQEAWHGGRRQAQGAPVEDDR